MGADGRNVTSISQPRNISAFVPAWSTVFRESSIELGSVAPFSVVNPEDAVQIIGGRPVIGSERIRRHARRKVREPRPPQRPSFHPVLTPQVFIPNLGGACFSLPWPSSRAPRSTRSLTTASFSPRLCGEFLIPPLNRTSEKKTKQYTK